MEKILKVPCIICGQIEVLEAEYLKDALEKSVNKPVDINEYELVCHKCSQTYQYRQKYEGNKWKKHFVLGPKSPVFKR